MNNFIEVKPEELSNNPFELIGKDWMLITAKNGNKLNTMTASWGGFGVMWGKNVAYIVIRPQRYTKEFVDSSDTFSLSFFDSNFRKQLAYLGNVSGRDEDKISNANLTVQTLDDTPCFEESKITIICKKLYAQDFNQECFIDNESDEKWYPDKDYHTLYISEIKRVLVKK